MVIELSDDEINKEDPWVEWEQTQTFMLELTKPELEAMVVGLEAAHESSIAQSIGLKGLALQEDGMLFFRMLHWSGNGADGGSIPTRRLGITNTALPSPR